MILNQKNDITKDAGLDELKRMKEKIEEFKDKTT